jgi:NAD+ synthase (glutamine-hydrolysing)
MLKIALAQMNVKAGHPDYNTETMLQLIKKAKKQQADLIIFPEMAIPGYLLGDTWEQTAFLEDCIAAGEEIIAAAQNIIVMFGNIAVDWQKKNNDGRVRKYNAFFTAQNGQLLQPQNMPYPFAIKTLLPNYREFDDTRHFFSLQKLAAERGQTAAELISPVQFTVRSRTYQAGCLLCEDGWSDDYTLAPIELLAKKAPLDLLVNISASPYTLGKNDKRNRVFSRQAAAAKTPLLYVNNIGLQNNGKTVYTFDGASTVYDRQGRIVLACGAYTEELACFDLETLEERAPLATGQEPEIAPIYRALCYGIRLFLDSIHMQRVVIGISGGIDSAVTAALYTQILGPDNVLLVNMPSVFNSATTRGLAQKLAVNLGCRYMVTPIQEAVDLTIRQLETTPIQDLTRHSESHFTISSFMTENIQARDRSARILAGAAAAFAAGFTCNANKAETTVGYSTLYGDQAGFLAALADLWKYQIYDLARYLNAGVYHREVIPQATIDIVPSAELSAAQNVDEGKGDPIRYPYHDYLFRSFVERWQKAAPQDILEWYAAGTLEQEIGCAPGLIQQYFATPAEFIADLEHWWNLFCGIAVAKRIQAPPILAVSRRAYGFDHREAQNGPYYTKKYRQLKANLLQAK